MILLLLLISSLRYQNHPWLRNNHLVMRIITIFRRLLLFLNLLEDAQLACSLFLVVMHDLVDLLQQALDHILNLRLRLITEHLLVDDLQLDSLINLILKQLSLIKRACECFSHRNHDLYLNVAVNIRL